MEYVDKFKCSHCKDTGKITIDKGNYLNYIKHYNISIVQRQFIINRCEVLEASCKFCEKSGNLLGLLRNRWNNIER